MAAVPPNADTIIEPSSSSKWLAAMNEESSMANNTWTLGTPPRDVKPIPVKWVFKLKHDAKGRVDRFKARVVVKGFKQEE